MKPRDYQVWEILDEIEKLETDMARVDRLRDFSDHTPLQYMLKFILFKVFFWSELSGP